MGEQTETRGTGGLTLFQEGVIASVLLLLVFAAFDDITTDNATAFPAEYSFLVASGVWLLSLAWRLVRQRHRFLGGMCAGSVAAAVWAQRAIGPGMVPGVVRPEYVVIIGAYAGLWVLSLTLLWLGWRSHQTEHPETA